MREDRIESAPVDEEGRQALTETRGTPRVPCRVLVLDGRTTGEIGHLRDFTVHGAFLESSLDLPNGLLPLTFVPPGAAESVTVDATVVRSREGGFGLRFQPRSSKDTRILHASFSDRLRVLLQREAVATLMAPDRPTFAVDDDLRIRTCLTAAVRERARVCLLPADRVIAIVGEAAAIDTETVRVTTRDTPDLHVGETLSALFALDFQHNACAMTVLGIEGRIVVLSQPHRIWFAERRGSSGRLPALGAWLQLPHGTAATTPTNLPLLDEGGGGLSFRAPKDCLLQPGMMLDGAVQIGSGGPRALPSLRVRNIRALDAAWVRVGVEFGAAANRGGPTWLDLESLRELPVDDPLPADLRVAIGQEPQVLRGILGRASARPRGNPLLVVLPGFGGRKETFARMAATVIANFRRAGLDLLVLRVDLSDNLGESWKGPGGEVPGQETLNHTVSGTVGDIRQILDWARHNPLVDPARIVLLSASFTSVAARHALVQPWAAGVQWWISWMGAADVQDAILHVSGHVDLMENHRRGRKQGIATVAGSLADLDHFWEDALHIGVVDVSDGVREMARLQVDVLWIRGANDRFMDPQKVDRLMVEPAGPYERRLSVIPSGHLPRSDAEAIRQFALLAGELAQRLHGRPIEAFAPPVHWLKQVEQAEWTRVPRRDVSDPLQYWSDYLLGQGGAGFDILRESVDYANLVEIQAALAQPEGRTVLDLGAGTGNVAEALARHRPARLLVADLVPAALEIARDKVERVAPDLAVETRVLNVEGTFERALRPFLEGELSGLPALALRAPAGQRVLFERLGASLDSIGWAYLRGGPGQASFLARHLGLDDAERALLEDLHDVFAALRTGTAPPTRPRVLPALRTEDLGPPFPEGTVDAVVLSLVLSYLEHPEDAVRMAAATLAPGGRLVASSLIPDADSSGIFGDLFTRLRTMPPDRLPAGFDHERLLGDAGAFLGAAASLLRIEEEGTFHFYDEEELRALLEAGGLRWVETVRCFGEPPQAIVVVAERP